MASLTDNQRQFVDHLVTTGCTPTEAARHAGYAEPNVEAYKLMRKEHVIAAIRDLRTRLIEGEAANVALQTLVGIMKDKAAPASARVSAARTVCEAAGHFDKGSVARSDSTSLADMSADQLADLIARIDAQVAKSNGAVH